MTTRAPAVLKTAHTEHLVLLSLLKEIGFQGYPCLLVFLAQMPQQRTLEQSGDFEGSLWSCLVYPRSWLASVAVVHMAFSWIH